MEAIHLFCFFRRKVRRRVEYGHGPCPPTPRIYCTGSFVSRAHGRFLVFDFPLGRWWVSLDSSQEICSYRLCESRSCGFGGSYVRLRNPQKRVLMMCCIFQALNQNCLFCLQRSVRVFVTLACVDISFVEGTLKVDA